MSITNQIDHFREIEFMSDETSDSFHEAGVKTVQDFLHVEKYFGSGVLQGGDATNFGNRIEFNIPIKGLVDGHRIFFDSTGVYIPSVNDGTVWIWLDVFDDLNETETQPDYTNGLILWAIYVKQNNIEQLIDERNVIPELPSRLEDLTWKGFYRNFDEVQRIGWTTGDAIIVRKELYIWNPNLGTNFDTGTYWNHWRTDQAAEKAFKDFVIQPDNVRVSADTTADTLTFIEGTNIRFRVENEDDATIFVDIRQDLDMNTHQIRRVKLIDMTGDLDVGFLVLRGDLSFDNAEFNDGVLATEINFIQGPDSTVHLILNMPDATMWVDDFHVVDADFTTGELIVHGGADVTGNVHIIGTLNGVDVSDHSLEHGWKESKSRLGPDEIDITGLQGILRDKQNAIQIQGYPISTTPPTEGDVLTFTSGEWTPTAELGVSFLEAMALMNWGFGDPSRFNYLTRQVDQLNFDRTDNWQPIHLGSFLDAFPAPGSRMFGFGAFDGKYVYASRMDTSHFVRWKNDSPWIDRISKPFEIYTGPTDAVVGGCFDGRYIYFGKTDGNLFLRFDTKHSSIQDGRSSNSFGWKDSTAWATYITTPNFRTTGLIFDGRYVYFASDEDSTCFMQFDTKTSFDANGTWTKAEMKSIGGARRFAYTTQTYDGRYVYFVTDPGDHLLRFDTELAYRGRDWITFNDATAWSKIGDVFLGQSGGLSRGGAFDGRYLYFAPSGPDATLFSRLDTTLDWSDQETSWDYMDFIRVFGEYSNVTQPFNDAVFDGRFVYYAPYGNAEFVRFDTNWNFGDATAWSTIRILDIINERVQADFDCAIYDGQYVNFIPNQNHFIVRCKAFPSGGMFSRWRT